jgi:hypothetical protein
MREHDTDSDILRTASYQLAALAKLPEVCDVLRRCGMSKEIDSINAELKKQVKDIVQRLSNI